MDKSDGQDAASRRGPGSKQTRVRLLRAAAELIAEQGWGAVRTRAVAERAGLPHGTVSYHFRGKQELLTEAALYTVAQALPLEELAGEPGTSPDLVDLLEGWLTGAETTDPVVSGVGMEAMLQAERDPVLRRRLAELMRHYREVMTDLVATANGARRRRYGPTRPAWPRSSPPSGRPVPAREDRPGAGHRSSHHSPARPLDALIPRHRRAGCVAVENRTIARRDLHVEPPPAPLRVRSSADAACWQVRLGRPPHGEGDRRPSGAVGPAGRDGPRDGRVGTAGSGKTCCCAPGSPRRAWRTAPRGSRWPRGADPQRFWLSVLDGLRETTAGSTGAGAHARARFGRLGDRRAAARGPGGAGGPAVAGDRRPARAALRPRRCGSSSCC